MNHPSPELVRATLRMRERAEEGSTRSLMCAGYVRSDSVVVYFPQDEIREPIVVAKSRVEEV